MALADRRDPFFAYNFLAEVNGLVVGGFSEVSGLQAEVEVQDYREGGLNDYVHKLIGPTRYPSNLILKHGLTDRNELWEWYQQVLQGIIDRRNLSIILLDNAGDERRRWNFLKAYPMRWQGPQLRAAGNEIAVQSLELVHRGLDLTASPFPLSVSLSASLSGSLSGSISFSLSV